MSRFHDYHFPGESDDYRLARDDLLAAEMDLRRQIAEVARLRQALPDGGDLPEDYVFDSEEGATALSSLFLPGHRTLVLYSFMFPVGQTPCPMCTSLLDGINGSAPQIFQRVSLAVIAKASVDEIRGYAAGRGWDKLRILSAGNSNYSRDYLGENNKGTQMPMLNVFARRDGGIVHTYGTELMVVKAEPGQDPRHVDMIWPLWNMLDFTPEGRDDWYPEV